MSDLVALAVFSFVSAATPGPNNMLLWAAGMQFGFASAIPHIVGICAGITVLSALTAAGLGVLVTTVPAVETTFKLIGSGYLLYLAYRIAGSHALQRPEAAKPLSFGEAVAFQFINPKAWVFVLAAIGTFRPDEMNVVVGSVLSVLVMVVVVIPAASMWAAGGTLLKRLTGERAHRTLSVVLGVMLVLTVAYIWM